MKNKTNIILKYIFGEVAVLFSFFIAMQSCNRPIILKEKEIDEIKGTAYCNDCDSNKRRSISFTGDTLNTLISILNNSVVMNEDPPKTSEYVLNLKIYYSNSTIHELRIKLFAYNSTYLTLSTSGSFVDSIFGRYYNDQLYQFLNNLLRELYYEKAYTP